MVYTRFTNPYCFIFATKSRNHCPEFHTVLQFPLNLGYTQMLLTRPNISPLRQRAHVLWLFHSLTRNTTSVRNIPERLYRSVCGRCVVDNELEVYSLNIGVYSSPEIPVLCPSLTANTPDASSGTASPVWSRPLPAVWDLWYGRMLCWRHCTWSPLNLSGRHPG